MTRRMKRAKSLKKATALFLTMSLLLSTLSITALATEQAEWEKEQQAVEVILDLMDDSSSHLSNFLNGDNKELSSADAGSQAFAYSQAVTRQVPVPVLAALVPPPIIQEIPVIPEEELEKLPNEGEDVIPGGNEDVTPGEGEVVTPGEGKDETSNESSSSSEDSSSTESSSSSEGSETMSMSLTHFSEGEESGETQYQEITEHNTIDLGTVVAEISNALDSALGNSGTALWRVISGNGNTSVFFGYDNGDGTANVLMHNGSAYLCGTAKVEHGLLLVSESDAIYGEGGNQSFAQIATDLSAAKTKGTEAYLKALEVGASYGTFPYTDISAIASAFSAFTMNGFTSSGHVVGSVASAGDVSIASFGGTSTAISAYENYTQPSYILGRLVPPTSLDAFTDHNAPSGIKAYLTGASGKETLASSNGTQFHYTENGKEVYLPNMVGGMQPGLTDTYIDFSSAFSAISSWSTSAAASSTFVGFEQLNGWRDNSGWINVPSGTSYITVNAEDLLKTGCAGVRAGSAVVVSILGSNVDLSGYGVAFQSGGASPYGGSSNVIWNFPEATSINQIPHCGHIVAPNASIYDRNQADIDGCIIARYADINGELHLVGMPEPPPIEKKDTYQLSFNKAAVVASNSATPALPVTFTFTLTAADGVVRTNTVEFAVADGSTQTVAFTGLTDGTYTLKEINLPDGWTSSLPAEGVSVTVNEADVTLADAGTENNTVTNTHFKQAYELSFTKEIAGEFTANDLPVGFTFDLYRDDAPGGNMYNSTLLQTEIVVFDDLSDTTKTVTFTDLPSGNYILRERRQTGWVSDLPTENQSMKLDFLTRVTIDENGVVTWSGKQAGEALTVVNTKDALTGTTLTFKKAVEVNPNGAKPQFPVSFTFQLGTQRTTVTLMSETDQPTVTFTDLKVNKSYMLQERDLPEGWISSIPSDGITVVVDKDGNSNWRTKSDPNSVKGSPREFMEITPSNANKITMEKITNPVITNTYNNKTGHSLTFNKSIVIPESSEKPDFGANGIDFTFTLYDGENKAVGVQTVNFGVTDTTKAVTFSGLEDGVYGLRETNSANWTSSIAGGKIITIDRADVTLDGNDAVTNTYGSYSLTFNKALALPTDAAALDFGADGIDFTFTLYDKGGHSVQSQTVNFKAGDTTNPVTFTGLENGDYTLAETKADGWISSLPAGGIPVSIHNASVELTGDGVTGNTVRNTYDRYDFSFNKAAVIADGSVEPTYPVEFTFTLENEAKETVQTQTVSFEKADFAAGKAVNFSNVPAGIYTLKEAALSGWSNDLGTAAEPFAKVTITASKGVEISGMKAENGVDTVTNTYDVKPDTYSLTFTKSVAVAAGSLTPDYSSGVVFTFTLAGPDGYSATSSATFSDSSDALVKFEGLKAGTYTLTETGLPAGWTSSLGESGMTVEIKDADVVLGADQKVTNTYDVKPATYGLSFNKSVVVLSGTPEFGSGLQFTFNLAGNGLNKTASVTFIGANQVEGVSFTDLPAGVYTLTETNLPTGWISSLGSGLTVTITDSNVTLADFFVQDNTVVNTYNPGTPPPTPPTPPTPPPGDDPGDDPRQDPRETPTVDIPNEVTPLAEMPGLPHEDEQLEEIPEDEIPLAQAPATGDPLMMWLAMLGASLLGLATILFSGRRKEN